MLTFLHDNRKQCRLDHQLRACQFSRCTFDSYEIPSQKKKEITFTEISRSRFCDTGRILKRLASEDDLGRWLNKLDGAIESEYVGE